MKRRTYEENPSGVGIALGIVAVLGVGWLLLRPKKAAAATKPVPPIDTSVPFEPFAVAQWASSRNIRMIWDDGAETASVIGMINSPNILFGQTGVPYFWSTLDQNGQRVQDMLATNEYMAWYKATKASQ